MKFIERKTSDPANYAKLGVEAPDTPTATSTLVEVVAGEQAAGRSSSARMPRDAPSTCASPRKRPARWSSPAISVDPDPKRWIDRLLIDIRGDTRARHLGEARRAGRPIYCPARSAATSTWRSARFPRAARPASSMSLNGQADALTAFNFDDMRPVPATPPAATDHATFRTFDGQVFEFAGRKEADKAWVTVTARRDAALAAQVSRTARLLPRPHRPPPAAPPPAPAAPTPAAAAAPAKPPDQTAERLTARAQGLEFEIPLYKYDTLFRTQEDLLEPKPIPARNKLRVPLARARDEQQRRGREHRGRQPREHHGTHVEHHARRFPARAARRRTPGRSARRSAGAHRAPAARRLPNTNGTASRAVNRMAVVRAMRDQNANSCDGGVEPVVLAGAAPAATTRASRADAAAPRSSPRKSPPTADANSRLAT